MLVKLSLDEYFCGHLWSELHFSKHLEPKTKSTSEVNFLQIPETLSRAGVGNSFCFAGHIGNKIGLYGPV